jgi:hemerythrin-like metal-binding protein
LANLALRTEAQDAGWELTHADVEVGILIFDIEHREMLDHIRRLYDGLAHGRPKHQVNQALARLLKVTNKHFQHEEDYMKTLGYPDYRQHADDHAALGANLQSFVDEHLAENANKERNLARVRTYFRKWLLDHILEHDRSLANFLAQKGIR